MITASVQSVTLIPHNGGFMDKLFHGTYITINIFDLFKGGYTITLAGLIVILIIAVAAAAVAERLTGAKPGKGMITPILLTLLGAYIFSAYVLLPTDLEIEGVRIIAALLGAIVFGVFYVLINKQVAPKKAAA
jgi:uncharacterized membrane protein YeaQ/YmgE (transglycosylase-associated protein family)